MTSAFLLSSAFLLGLLGSTHCVGMCGGIVSFLGVSRSGSGSAVNNSHLLSFLFYHSVYNAGRILSYAAAGLLVAALGAGTTSVVPTVSFPVGMLFSGLFMVLLGFYVTGWWRILGKLERAGAVLWSYIRPLSKFVLPVRSLPHAFILGLVWGWLPCGLVYSALALAAVSANPVLGSMIMMSFGLGTLPMLLLVGSGAGQFNALVQNIMVRRLAGLSLIAMGLFSCLSAFSHQGKHAHHHAGLQSPEVRAFQEAGLS